MNPEEVARVADLELNAYSPLQETIHHIPHDDPAKSHEKTGKQLIEDIFVPLVDNVINWASSPQLTRFNGIHEHTSIKFQIPYCFSRVYSFHVCMTLPPVSVIKGYEDRCRIAWTPNVAANLLGRGRVVYGMQIAEDYPVYALDIERQFNCGKIGQQEAQISNVGSVPLLTRWSTSKPKFGPLYVSPKFHFTRDLSHCIRASLLDVKSRVSVTFTPRTYQQVLRMQVRENSDAEWKSIPCDPRLVTFDESSRHEIREGTALDYVAVGEVVVVNTEQRFHELNCSEGFLNYIKHFEVHEKAHVGFGEVAEIIVGRDAICVALFIVAFNERAATYCCYSNYTTNPDNMETGIDPIGHCDIFYGDTLAKSYDAHFMEKIASDRCPSQPLEPGYHVIRFSANDPFEVSSPHALGGIVTSRLNMKIRVTLNHYSQEMEGAKRDDKFTVVVNALMVKKLEYIKVDDGPEPAFSIAMSE